VERRAPALATSKWWKEERHGVFLDYNQNAKDRTVAGAYSVRPKPDARVSAPVTWDELFACAPEDFTLRTMPARFAAIGDRHADIDRQPCSLDALLSCRRGRKPKASATHRGRRTMPKQEGEPPARAAVPEGRDEVERPARVDEALIEIARAANKDDALAGLERWKARHSRRRVRISNPPTSSSMRCGPLRDVDAVRVNLEHVPDDLRPAQEPLDPDYDPWGSTTPRPGRSRRARPAE
jgi:hypothetical protein